MKFLEVPLLKLSIKDNNIFAFYSPGCSKYVTGTSNTKDGYAP